MPKRALNAIERLDWSSKLVGMPRGKPRFVDPMKARLVNVLPTGSQWLYEVKFDGFRALCLRDAAKLSLISRNGKSLKERYPTVASAVGKLPVKSAVLDGEIVAVDAEGRSSFQLLQSYQAPGGHRAPLLYYLFDLLHLDGRDLLTLPLQDRKQLLQQLLLHAPPTLRFSASLEAPPRALLRELKRQGLEGLMAKLKDSPYEPGKRSGAWSKFKWSAEQEFVIGGYTPPKGARGYFGAILVGYYQGAKLLFASKVGAGFDQKLLQTLHAAFQTLVRQDCPFVNLPERLPGGLGPAEMRKCTWLEPKLICQVRFTEWTRDQHLRHPLFLGMRDDKLAKEVIRESP